MYVCMYVCMHAEPEPNWPIFVKIWPIKWKVNHQKKVSQLGSRRILGCSPSQTVKSEGLGSDPLPKNVMMAQQASQGISKMTYHIWFGMKKKQVVFWWSIISIFFHPEEFCPSTSPVSRRLNISGSPKLRCCLAATPVKRCPGRFGWRDSAGMDDPFVGWVQWVQSLEHITQIPTLQSTQQRTQHVIYMMCIYRYMYIYI